MDLVEENLFSKGFLKNVCHFCLRTHEVDRNDVTHCWIVNLFCDCIHRDAKILCRIQRSFEVLKRYVRFLCENRVSDGSEFVVQHCVILFRARYRLPRNVHFRCRSGVDRNHGCRNDIGDIYTRGVGFPCNLRRRRVHTGRRWGGCRQTISRTQRKIWRERQMPTIPLEPCVLCVQGCLKRLTVVPSRWAGDDQRNFFRADRALTSVRSDDDESGVANRVGCHAAQYELLRAGSERSCLCFYRS